MADNSTKTSWEDWTDTVSSWQDMTSDIPKLVREDISKARMKPEEAARGFKSLTLDPLSVQYAMGYKDRKYSLTYDVLKRIPHQLSVVGAIINTRVNQVAAFSVPYRASKSVGFVVKHKDPAHLTSKSEQKFIQELEKFIYNCGHHKPNPHNGKKRDDFETFLKKLVRDSLIYDQACALPGAWVELADGTGCPIESVVSGMKVRTHTGDIKSVLYPTSRSYSGEIVEVQVRGQKLSLTSGHPVYAAKRISHKGNKVELGEPAWIPASELTTDMYVAYPRLKSANNSVYFDLFAEPGRKYPVGPLDKLISDTGYNKKTIYQILTGTYTKNGPAVNTVLSKASELGVSYQTRRVVEPQTEMTPLWGRLIGLYLAEGNVAPASVRFTFHEDEVELVKFIQDFGAYYGINSTIFEYEDRQATTVILNSKELANFLKYHCGTGSSLKKVPSWVYNAPEDTRKALLRGYLEGDGNIRPGRVGFTTISRDLFTGIRMLFSAQGVYVSEIEANDKYINHATSYRGNVSGDNYQKLAKEWGWPISECSKRCYITDEDNLYIKITSVSNKIVKDVQVYNMEVEDDHSYVMQGFVNHNCIEIVPDRRGIPYEFMAVDASTIRIAAQNSTLGPNSSMHNREPAYSGRLLQYMQSNDERAAPFRSVQLYNRNNDRPAYVQVTNGQIENVYTEDELVFGVRNPRTDIYIQGYGYSELEQLITIITSHLYAEEYNRRFFMQGCVAGNTPVYTDKGIIPIEELVGSSFKTWNGEEFVESDAVYSGIKRAVRTALQNDQTIITSPDHKFLTFDEEGNTKMMPISALTYGDYVAQSDEVVEFDPIDNVQVPKSVYHQVPEKQTGILDSEFYEFIGWLVGDGYISERLRSKNSGNNKKNYTISCVFGPKDDEVFEKFQAMLDARGFKYQLRKSGGAWGGTPINCLIIRNKGLFNFLKNVVGVSTNKAHQKKIPSRVFKESVEHRAAFIRGLFSADGFIKKNYQAYLCSSSRELISDVQHVLWSLGVHSNISYTLKNNSGKNCYYLRVSNNNKFASTIGFIQSYKKQTPNKRDSLGKVPRALQKSLYYRLYGKELPKNRWLTRRDLQRLAFNNNVELEALKYRWIEIESISDTGIDIPVYDIRQTHHKHQWSAGSCIVSNSAPKGVLNFKGDSMTPDMLEGFRRQWRANLEGVENCLSGDTRVYTRESGFASLEEICGDREEVPVQIWTGTSWETGLVYKTKEPKVLCHLELDNATTVSSSPDHKFMVVGETGDPEWRTQAEIKEDDVLLVNKQDTSAGTELFCLGESVSEEFMECLGWFLGDGSVNYRKNDRGYDAGTELSWFYNPVTEKDILDRHLRILQQYFPKAYKYERQRSEKEIERIKKSYGFKNVQKSVSKIVLQDKIATKWFESHGFINSQDGKIIPPQLFIMSQNMRAAYLRGLFSADGNNAKGRSPELACSDHGLRETVKHLLLSLGIRTCYSEGRTKVCIKGSDRSYIEAKSILRIKDRDVFFEKVSFLQDHKAERKLKNVNEANKTDYIPRSTITKYLTQVRQKNSSNSYKLLSKRQRMNLNSILSGKDGCSKKKLIEYMTAVDLKIPDWLKDFNTAKIRSSVNTGIYVPMYDVSINHVDHTFVANNIVCHNSWKTPILQSEQGVDWIDLHPSNREMEYNAWIEYLIKVTCFTEDTPITLSDGTVCPISAVKPGDKVSTLSGSSKTVDNVQVTEYSGKLHHIRAGDTMKVTPEHPLFVSSSNIVDGVRVIEEPEWKNAEDVVEGTDYLLVPKKTYKNKGQCERIDLVDYLQVGTFRLSEDGSLITPNSNRVTWINRYIDLTEDNAFVLGLYLAEGNATNYATFFTFSADEQSYVEYVKDFADYVGARCNTYNTKETTANIRIYSTLLSKAFSNIFGSKADNKKIPSEIINTKNSVQKAFLSGALAGDGSVFSSGTVTTTISLASERAVEQLRTLFLYQDVYTHKYDILASGFGRDGEPSNMYRLDVYGPQLKKLAGWMFGPKGDKLRTLSNNISNKSKIYENDSYFFVPVSENSVFDFDGKVYNLEVKDEHTYQAHRFGVHNCAIFLMDPAELNFDLHGGVQQTPLFESSQEWKLKASRDRGLKPLLRFIAKLINENIISKIDDHFIFDFVGLDELTEQEKHTLRTEQVASYLTLNEVRRADDLDDLEYGDMPMNPTYIQAMQIKQQMEQQEQQAEQQKQMAAQQAQAPGTSPDDETGLGPVGEPGEGEDSESPQYTERFGKSIEARSGEKYLEIELDDWKDAIRGE